MRSNKFTGQVTEKLIGIFGRNIAEFESRLVDTEEEFSEQEKAW